MTTARDIVYRALEIVGVKGAGVTPSSDDADLGLRVLQSILDQWGVEPHSVIGLTELTYTPTAGAQSITIGTSGNINTTMPSRIDSSSFLRLSGTDYPIYFASTFDEYTEKATKSSQGFPYCCYWMPANTGLGKLYLYPAANGGEFHLWVDQQPISGFDTMVIGTTIILPLGWKKALEYSLADLLTIDFSVDKVIAERIKREAANSTRIIRRVNVRVPQMTVDVLPDSSGIYDLESDRY